MTQPHLADRGTCISHMARGRSGSSRSWSRWPSAPRSEPSRAAWSPTSGSPRSSSTLGGLLIWRGLIFQDPAGPRRSPPWTKNFAIIGGNLSSGSAIGASGGRSDSGRPGLVAILLCAGIAYALIASRRKRREYGFPVPPAVGSRDIDRGGLGGHSVRGLGPEQLPAGRRCWATQYGQGQRHHPSRRRLIIPVGLAAPVLILPASAGDGLPRHAPAVWPLTSFAIGGTPRRPFRRYQHQAGDPRDVVLLGVLCALAGASRRPGRCRRDQHREPATSSS